MALITIGELIDRSWEHYHKEFSSLMSVSGWILLVAIFNVATLALYPSASRLLTVDTTLTKPEAVGVAMYAFSNWVLGPLLGLWIFITLIRLIRSQLSGKRAGIREALADGKKYFLPTLAVTAMIFLILVAVVLIGFGPSLILSLLATVTKLGFLTVLATISLVVGVMASLVLGIRWSVHYYFAPFTLLVDDVRGKAALTAARKLVDGRFWQVLIRLALPKILFILVGVLLMALVQFVFSVVSSAFVGLSVDVQLRISTIVLSVLSTLVAALINPLIVASDLMLYQSLKR
ncbi:MAG: hypothetical protein WCO25_02425 [Candidatus Uhrbacteria bacterium]